MKILAIDLGKYKSVACSYVTATGTARFATVVTHVLELDRLLLRESPDLVVIETCSIAGWVHDLCCQRGVKCQVANPGSEAWKWKNVKAQDRPRRRSQTGSARGDPTAPDGPCPGTRNASTSSIAEVSAVLGYEARRDPESPASHRRDSRRASCWTVAVGPGL